MNKIIIKEAGIVILLLIAVSLVLAILFYDYIPNNKIVPIEIQAYSIPEDIKEELKEALPTEQNIVRTYYIDDTDLNLYESTNEYDKGKPNPFSHETTDTTDITDTDSEIGDDINQDEVYITTPGKNY